MRFGIFSVGLAAILTSASPSAAQDVTRPSIVLRATDPGIKWGPCPPIFTGDCNIAVLQGDPAKPNADVFLRIGGGTVLPTHRHSSAERMILISGTLEVRYEGAAPATLLPGNYAYGPANAVHRAKCVSKQRCILFIAFEGPVDAALEHGSPDEN